MSAEDNHLEESSTKERIELVSGNRIRENGQIILSFLFVGAMLGYLGWYSITKADAEFQNMMVIGMYTLFSMGVGAALAIFGLGRTVGRK